MKRAQSIKAPQGAKGQASRLKKSTAGEANEASETLQILESLVAEIRATPANFPNVQSMTNHLNGDRAWFTEQFQRHYHRTPADVLARIRFEAVKRHLLVIELTPAEIAEFLNYESVTAFRDDFQRFNGLAPEAFQQLKTEKTFEIRLPEGYPLGYLRRALGRDEQSVTERLEGDTYTTGVEFGNEARILTMRLAKERVHVSVESPGFHMPQVHAMVVGLLGLEQNAVEFGVLTKRLNLSHLIEGRPQLRIAQTHTVFDGLLWAIIGQQINFAFACSLKRRLVEKAGRRMSHGLFTLPAPQVIAEMEPGDLLPLQFSRQKADYVVSVARLVAGGQLDLDALRYMSATRAEQTLLAVRGLGPWSVNYLMMRSLGFPDCLPLGDTGVTSGLRILFGLMEKPDLNKIRQLMAPFSPFRSLATAHLWQLGKPIPD